MKTKLFVLCTMLCAMLFAGCEPNEPATSNKVVTGDVTDITRSSAVFHGTVNVDISAYNNVEFGIMIAETKEELNAREGEMLKAKALLGKEFKIEIGNLEPETKFYYCAWLFLNSTQYEFGEIKEFETIASTVATVTTNPITEIMTQSAVAGGCVKDDGGASVTERGVVYSLSKEPTISNYKVKSGSGVGEFTCNLTNLQDNAIYYVRAYAINQKGIAYGSTESFTTKKGIYENGYECVDLDLSVKWATMNVGASKAEDYGSYFAWGETYTKTIYDWNTYQHHNSSLGGITKYNTRSNHGSVDNKTQLDLKDDAASANWGGAWRMPSDAELTELRTECIWTWITQNGVNGYKVTSKSNGNSIFLPAAGMRLDGNLYYASDKGYYRSSSLCTGNPSYTWSVMFDSSDVSRYDGGRANGYSVRPVCP